MGYMVGGSPFSGAPFEEVAGGQKYPVSNLRHLPCLPMKAGDWPIQWGQRASSGSENGGGGEEPEPAMALLHEWKFWEGDGSTIPDSGTSNTPVTLSFGVGAGSAPTRNGDVIDFDTSGGVQVLQSKSVPADMALVSRPDSNYVLAWIAAINDNTSPADMVTLRSTGNAGTLSNHLSAGGRSGLYVDAHWYGSSGRGWLLDDSWHRCHTLLDESGSRWARFQLRLVGSYAELWMNGMLLFRVYQNDQPSVAWLPSYLAFGADLGDSDTLDDGINGSMLWACAGPHASSITVNALDDYMLTLMAERLEGDSRYDDVASSRPDKLLDIDYTPADAVGTQYSLYRMRHEAGRHVDYEDDNGTWYVRRWGQEGGFGANKNNDLFNDDVNPSLRPILQGPADDKYVFVSYDRRLAWGISINGTNDTSITGRVTYFCVIDYEFIASTRYIIDTGNSSGSVRLGFDSLGNLRVLDGATWNGGAMVFNTKILLIWSRQRSNHNKIWINGGSPVLDTGAGSNGGNGQSIGGHGSYNCKWYDLIALFSCAADNPDDIINSVGSQLAAHHGLAWSDCLNLP